MSNPVGKIFIVEDEFTKNVKLSEILSGEGFAIVSAPAEEGDAVIQKIIAAKPDVIITDANGATDDHPLGLIEKLKGAPELKGTEIFVYAKVIEVSFEVKLRKLKLSEYFTKEKTPDPIVAAAKRFFVKEEPIDYYDTSIVAQQAQGTAHDEWVASTAASEDSQSEPPEKAAPIKESPKAAPPPPPPAEDTDAKLREQQKLAAEAEALNQKEAQEAEAKQREQQRLAAEAEALKQKEAQEAEAKQREQQRLAAEAEALKQKEAQEAEAKQREQQRLAAEAEALKQKEAQEAEAKQREQQRLAAEAEALAKKQADEARRKAEEAEKLEKLAKELAAPKKQEPTTEIPVAAPPPPSNPVAAAPKSSESIRNGEIFVGPAEPESKDAQKIENDPESSFNLGLIYMDMGMADEAAREFERAAVKPSLKLEALTQTAICLRRLKNYGGSLAKLTEGFKHAAKPEDKLRFQYEIGVTLQEGGKIREALAYFDTIHKTDNNYLDVDFRIQTINYLLHRGA